MNRITEKQLEAIVKRLNEVLKAPLEPYKKVGSRHVAQVGNYHLSWAYGGVSLHKMVNKSGGIEDVFRCGHTTKRDLANRMWAFIDWSRS